MSKSQPSARRSLLDRYLDFATRNQQVLDEELVGEGDWAAVAHEPRRSRTIIWVSLLVVLVFLIWASIAELDEVTRGEGKVVPSREVQIIQSLDGGIVSMINVREGQFVKQGELMLKIDPTRVQSSLRENRAQYLSLLARATRLRALSEGKPYVAPEEVLKEQPQVAEQERVLYESTIQSMEANIAIARQQLAQRSQELIEVRTKRDQAAENYELAAKELAKTKPLVQSGAVSDVELLRLERDVSRSKGERDQAAAQMPRIEASIAEANRKIQEVELTARNQVRGELSETMAKLNSLSAGSEGLADRVKQTEVRSPVNGTVKRLMINTVGGVVQPGKDIIEVVPSDDALLLEAKILPKDIGFLRPGQPALVKFTAYDFSIYGGLEATLEHIGADTITDDKGNAFYVIRVRTKKAYIGERRLPIIPGMVAEVDILTGKKTILSYLMKPVLRAKATAMTER
ncbi:HlyD family type I secretion periplasmic adaptor subunit [Leeia aquatica]|uniref:Membrane fusion protein (MFP) family protein n=1 Tax=Leeia aquatica TaxID=2725557 RepID=A0A847S6G3_9NEIS|nr:HlyD family type I secretion periplasmic adaptor subunit [Leeia aquatica]NLR75353.1 HlyD family type I secretion periplasmic adaptor subunit [Leeia aquatica]